LIIAGGTMTLEKFSIPLDWVEMTADEVVEVEVSGEDTVRVQHDLAEHLRQLPELRVKEFVRKTFDIPQLVYIAGAAGGGAGGIVQAIDVIWGWYRATREKKNVRIVIRTAEGQVVLNAETIDAARKLAEKLDRATKRS
jgi:hypothetical protein